MATIVKTPSGPWKALIRKRGWPATANTFRTKRDAEDWSRRAEDEMVRDVYIDRSNSEHMTFELALGHYLAEVTPTKRPSTQLNETCRAGALREFLGKYAMAAIGGWGWCRTQCPESASLRPAIVAIAVCAPVTRSAS